ncbi:MAG: TfoX/Sxy family protein [Candidatus Goldiibacteriota bacterium]|jgi:TfoX/Sxy family transcriptional regulator of competence genes
MSTDRGFADFVIDQLHDAGIITAKKMFGEYGIYMDSLIIGFACDNRLFIKPTDAGREYIEGSGWLTQAPPYPGAKLYYLIEDRLDDRDWICGLARATYVGLIKNKKSISSLKLRKKHRG